MGRPRHGTQWLSRAGKMNLGNLTRCAIFQKGTLRLAALAGRQESLVAWGPSGPSAPRNPSQAASGRLPASSRAPRGKTPCAHICERLESLGVFWRPSEWSSGAGRVGGGGGGGRPRTLACQPGEGGILPDTTAASNISASRPSGLRSSCIRGSRTFKAPPGHPRDQSLTAALEALGPSLTFERTRTSATPPL